MERNGMVIGVKSGMTKTGYVLVRNKCGYTAWARSWQILKSKVREYNVTEDIQ